MPVYSRVAPQCMHGERHGQGARHCCAQAVPVPGWCRAGAGAGLCARKGVRHRRSILARTQPARGRYGVIDSSMTWLPPFKIGVCNNALVSGIAVGHSPGLSSISFSPRTRRTGEVSWRNVGVVTTREEAERRRPWAGMQPVIDHGVARLVNRQCSSAALQSRSKGARVDGHGQGGNPPNKQIFPAIARRPEKLARAKNLAHNLGRTDGGASKTAHPAEGAAVRALTATSFTARSASASKLRHARPEGSHRSDYFQS